MKWHPFSRVRKYKDPDDETEIVVVHKDESSNSRLVIALFFLLLAVASIGQQFYFQGQRSSDLAAQHAKDEAFQQNQKELNDTVQQQLLDAQKDRDDLRKLVVAVLTAKTPEQSRAALEKFLAASRIRASRSPSPRPSARASRASRPAPHPSPQPRPSSTRRPEPQPSPSHSPSPKPSPTATPCTIRNPLTGKCILIGAK